MKVANALSVATAKWKEPKQNCMSQWQTTLAKMSAPSDTINLESKGNQMPKPRMTKAEKAIVKSINEIVFKTPEERNGKQYLDRVAFNKLPDQTKKIYLDLVINKTY